MSAREFTSSPPVTPGFTARLGDARAADPASAGVKAANLSVLAAAGFQVPDGFVLTAGAFDTALALASSAANGNAPDLTQVTLPGEIDRALRYILDELGDVPLAVRSSAVAEDLPDASYAGQYDTVLGARGIDELRDAVRQCWVSAFSEHALAYRARQQHADTPRMAILIQRLVEAAAAGVAFTLDPVSGERDVTLVSAVRGLGERLVSGAATPDEWVIRDGNAVLRHNAEGAIDTEQALRVAELARRVEAHAGGPQDIEWAMASGEVWLLQARPVTGVRRARQIERIEPNIQVPEGFWRRDAVHSSHPISPMTRSSYLPMCETVVSEAFREFGLLLDRLEMREIGGYVYLRIVPPGGKEGPAPPWWVLAVVVRVVPDARAMIRRARDAERSGLGERLIERWWGEWREDLNARIEELRGVDLPALSDEGLEAHIATVTRFVQEGVHIHFRLAIPYLKAVAQFAMFCRDELGWDAREAMEPVDGLSTMSTEPARRLSDLAAMARQRPATAAIIERNQPDALEQLHTVDPGLARAFEDYQHAFGARALGEDLMEPTLAERPSITLAVLRGLLADGRDVREVDEELAKRRESAIAGARQRLRDKPEALERFDALLAKLQRAYPVREDNSYATYQAPIGLLRYGVLEIGNRLAERGVIASRDDVMFLELPEALDALRSGARLRELAARRQGEFEWALANPGPATYGKDPGPPPDLRGVPVEARELMQSLMWFIENDVDAPVVDGGGLRGIPASPGVYRGPVRVVRGEDEFHKLRSGDVLVCPITSPVWSVLFASAGALVTDTGGVLSHSAIVAREHGIPAVVATGTATSALRDGQIVTVDGNSGEIHVEA